MPVTRSGPNNLYDDPYWAAQQRQRMQDAGINVDQMLASHPDSSFGRLGYNLTPGGGQIQTTNPFADNYADNSGIYATQFLIDDPEAIDPATRQRWAASWARTGNASEFQQELTAERNRQWAAAGQRAWDQQQTPGYQAPGVIGARTPTLQESLDAGGGHFRPMSSLVPGSTQFNEFARTWQPVGYSPRRATTPPQAGTTPPRAGGLAGAPTGGLAGVTPVAPAAPTSMPAPGMASNQARTAGPAPARPAMPRQGFSAVRRQGIGSAFGQRGGF